MTFPGAFFESGVQVPYAKVLLVQRAYSCPLFGLGECCLSIISSVWLSIVSSLSILLGVAADATFVFWSVLVGLSDSCWARQILFQEDSISTFFNSVLVERKSEFIILWLTGRMLCWGRPRVALRLFLIVANWFALINLAPCLLQCIFFPRLLSQSFLDNWQLLVMLGCWQSQRSLNSFSSRMSQFDLRIFPAVENGCWLQLRSEKFKVCFHPLGCFELLFACEFGSDVRWASVILQSETFGVPFGWSGHSHNIIFVGLLIFVIWCCDRSLGLWLFSKCTVDLSWMIISRWPI